MKSFHTTVMLKETISALDIKSGGKYIDCTFGEGGHSYKIFQKLTSKGFLLSIDQDERAIAYGNETFEKELNRKNWLLQQSNFSELSQISKSYFKEYNGILMDLGISSGQIEEKGRGFSYLKDNEPLDMRMNRNLSITAYDLLKALNEKELAKLFYKYGEEKYSKRIAKAIKKSNSIENVGDLTSLIYRVVPATTIRGDSHHPARRVFQALRIAVNDEHNSLKKGLDEAYKILASKGRLCVITFHSLEDRIVKEYFAKLEKEKKVNRNILETPKQEEINLNSKARSAKLRYIEKL